MSGELRATWEYAVDLGARGRYAESWDTLRSLRGTPLESLASSTYGSHLRQVGAVLDAADADARALECAADDEALADALIGLAADDVARGEAETAARWLSRAGDPAPWRVRTRWLWVHAELALLQGDPSRAVERAALAVECCLEHSTRHAVKSRIILAAAAGAAGRDGLSGVDLLGVAGELRQHAWTTLQWPLALVVEDLIGRGLAPAAVVAAWPGIRADGQSAVSFIAEHLPEERRTAWTARPDIARLIGTARPT